MSAARSHPPSPGSSDSERTPKAIGAFLEQLADETGDPAFRRAARALCQQAPGRPRSSTNAALIRRAQQLIASGKPKSAHHAYATVAKSVTEDPKKQRSIIESLRRYFTSSKKGPTK